MQRPDVQYTMLGDAAVAYQVVGEGPIDLLLMPPVFSHLDMLWEYPLYPAFVERLASFSRVITFDKRGTGLSDPLLRGGVPTLEERMDDVLAVMDAAGSERAALFGPGEGANVCALFAATFPDRVSHLILFNATPRLMKAPDFPWGWEPNETPMDETIARWNDPTTPAIQRTAPSHVKDPRFLDYWMRYIRSATSPGQYRALQRVAMQIDIRGVLPTISVPSLVLHRKDNTIVVPGAGRVIAEKIPGARFTELPGGDHWVWFGDIEPVIAEVQEFLTGERPVAEPDRILCTVLVTDIVDSTSLAADLGDQRWRTLLAGQRDLVRRELGRHRGKEIDTAGDGFLAIFDGPARAVHCAEAIVASVRSLDIEVRAGVHTGECELLEDGVAGIAVHIASRVASKAAASEILTSSTVKDLVAGSGIRFVDRGTHALKGVPDEWHLFAVESAA
jgi:pimeloyl-ACP methyl ester carboxylesterase